MNRKEFLKSCACGLCACGAAALMAPAESFAAETAPAEDWRLGFVQRRYAKLIEILSGRLEKKALNEVLFDLGTFCSSGNKQPKFRGDFDGFCKHFKEKFHEDISYDREKGIITMTSSERTDCFCPLHSRLAHTPDAVCNCSLGWQQQTWETVLQKKVRVELIESVLRGGKRCIFKIHVEKDDYTI